MADSGPPLIGRSIQAFVHQRDTNSNSCVHSSPAPHLPGLVNNQRYKLNQIPCSFFPSLRLSFSVAAALKHPGETAEVQRWRRMLTSAVRELLLLLSTRWCEERATALKATYLFYCSTHSSSDTCIYKYRQLLFFFFSYTVKEQIGKISR